MLSVDQAVEAVLAESELMPVQYASLRRATGRALRAPVVAPHDSPPFDTSAMDGFAVRAEDIGAAGKATPVALPIQGETSAGDPARQTLEPAKALRINTGAPLPVGADAVVRVEDVQVEGASVRFSAPIAIGAAVRRAGEDYKRGRTMLAPGRRLDPASVGLLASLGQAGAEVSRRPRLALIATGDELVEPGSPLGHGQIYNSTRHALFPLLESFGAEVHDLGVAPDDPEATRRALARGFDFDLLVTTGGVSMGSRDLVRPTLLDLGAREVFWQVKQRPGKPLYLAKKGGGSGATLCFGLPGNPVSVFVTALVYVRAALLRMQGVDDVDLPWRSAVAGAAFEKKPGLTLFARVDAKGEFRDGFPVVRPSPGQGSHQFSALAASSGLVRLGEASGDAPAGARVDYLEFARILG